MQAAWTVAGISATIAVGASLADRARARRRDIHRVGWVPWSLVTFLALLVAVVAAASALKR